LPEWRNPHSRSRTVQKRNNMKRAGKRTEDGRVSAKIGGRTNHESTKDENTKNALRVASSIFRVSVFRVFVMEFACAHCGTLTTSLPL
jgi:hypothetical protein